MERHEILEMMGTLQLSGMRAAYDEIVSDGREAAALVRAHHRRAAEG